MELATDERRALERWFTKNGYADLHEWMMDSDFQFDANDGTYVSIDDPDSRYTQEQAFIVAWFAWEASES